MTSRYFLRLIDFHDLFSLNISFQLYLALHASLIKYLDTCNICAPLQLIDFWKSFSWLGRFQASVFDVSFKWIYEGASRSQFWIFVLSRD